MFSSFESARIPSRVHVTAKKCVHSIGMGITDGRSIHSSGSKGGVMSPDLRRSATHRRSDRGDRSRDYDREHRSDRRGDDHAELSPRTSNRR